MDKNAEQILGQAQLYQQQMQIVLTQKEALGMELREIENALEKLRESGTKDAYRITGPLLIKSPIDVVNKDLKEKESFMKLKVQQLEKQEKKIKEKLEELRERLSGTAKKPSS